MRYRSAGCVHDAGFFNYCELLGLFSDYHFRAHFGLLMGHTTGYFNFRLGFGGSRLLPTILLTERHEFTLLFFFKRFVQIGVFLYYMRLNIN